MGIFNIENCKVSQMTDNGNNVMLDSSRAESPYWLPDARPYPRVFRGLLRWLQRRCSHHALKADMLEGQAHPYTLRWCETCGAIWLTIDGAPCGGSPRMPEPTWERP